MPPLALMIVYVVLGPYDPPAGATTSWPSTAAGPLTLMLSLTPPAVVRMCVVEPAPSVSPPTVSTVPAVPLPAAAPVAPSMPLGATVPSTVTGPVTVPPPTRPPPGLIVAGPPRLPFTTSVPPMVLPPANVTEVPLSTDNVPAPTVRLVMLLNEPPGRLASPLPVMFSVEPGAVPLTVPVTSGRSP